MKNKKVQKFPKDETGQRAFVPPWLANPDLVGPCMCGEPFDPEIPWLVATEQSTRLKRWWHYPCWSLYMNPDDDDDD